MARGALLFRFVVRLLVISTCASADDNRCSVCKDGHPVPFPERQLDVEGIPVNDCQTLEITGSFLTEGSDLCNSIQSIGTLCGCSIPPGACKLCKGALTRPDRELSKYPASDFVFGAPEGVPMTCETIEAWLHSQQDSSTTCSSMRQDLAAECGCPQEDRFQNEAEAENIDNMVSPTSSPAPTSLVPLSCTLCPGGGDISLPEKELDLGDLPVQSCGDLMNFAGLLTSGSGECAGLRSLGPMCGCPDADYTSSCTLCPRGEKAPKPNLKLDWYNDYRFSIAEAFASIGNSLTCEMVESTLTANPEDLLGVDSDFSCLSAQLKSHICGCRPDWRQLMLTWSYRFSAILSIMVSGLSGFPYVHLPE